MYSEKVMDHFSNPRNVGEIEDANAVGQVGNPQCGDIMKIYMKINDDTQVIEEVKFKTFGCGAAIATSSMATELVKGKTVLIIAHRMRTVESADNIVVLSDGIVAENGTHEELMKENGLYRRLVDLQTASANWKLSV